MRTHFIDPDFRPVPKTKRFCCVCYKDLKGKAYPVKTDDTGMCVVHPEDVTAECFDAYIGPECSKKVPKEFLGPEEYPEGYHPL
jgi:hypothetical protein